MGSEAAYLFRTTVVILISCFKLSMKLTMKFIYIPAIGK